ncbi:Asp23/Gls24 family envelope stress response protein [Corynebacterium pyruviciproducens]|uniref:Asp23/Gls24 family envelope stress response protein n=1 Tax=Corynebacterium pyruviciproducens TaxID=598660 RepID=A0AAF0YU96_9CORY|nr:Asp23/Gls24 family envelope stress response protein [Corynebacterium pyruviciproducens]MDK7213205.1 Asp23/Gls24 family envelope stress response protein [Corynebacterium pyruviciproducens]WOT01663.1 Asp23/Gls24 family envelope stress response protein [Corynebacterium pyruviciproducens]
MTTPETTTPFTGAALPEVAKVPEDFSNKRGMNHFSERALSTIIQQAILSVPGVVQRSSGLEKITGRSYPRFNIDADEPTDSVSIDSTIAVTWPSPVTAVAETVRDTVRTWVTRLTGITNVSVNVAVGPVVNAPTRVQMNHLLSFGLEPTPVPVRYTETTPVSPTVKPQKGLRPIDRGHLPELMPIDPGREVTLRAIDAGTIPEAWVPDIPAPRFVRPTSLPNAKPVLSVMAPQPVTPATPRVKKPARVVSPRTPQPVQAISPTVKKPRPLIHPSIAETRVRPVKTLAPIQPVPVRTPPPIRVISPRIMSRDVPAAQPRVKQQALKPITISKSRVKEVLNNERGRHNLH